MSEKRRLQVIRHEMMVIWTEDDKTQSNIANVLKVKLRGTADG